MAPYSHFAVIAWSLVVIAVCATIALLRSVGFRVFLSRRAFRRALAEERVALEREEGKR